MPFVTSTRLRSIQLPAMTQPADGGITRIDLPKVGILMRVYLIIRGTSTGAVNGVGTGATFGISAHINRVRLAVNSGIDLINVSGPGYHYLLGEMIDSMSANVLAEANGRVIPVIGAYNLDMVLPVSLNNRDETGLVMLQNEQTLATLEIDWASNASVDGGAVYAANLSAIPVIDYFEVPSSVQDWPRLDTVHQVLEDNQAVAAGGEFTYQWPRGNTYAGCYHLVTGTTFTTARLRVQQGNIIYDETPNSLGVKFTVTTGKSATLAAPSVVTGNNRRVFWDLLGSDGLGSYGSVRDLIASARLTDLASVINFAAAGNLRSVRRQLITLGS